MNQTHFECYEFDADVVLIPIAACAYTSMCSVYEWMRIVEFLYCWLTHTQNVMNTYE